MYPSAVLLFKGGDREARWFVVQELSVYVPPFLRVSWKLLEFGFEVLSVRVVSRVEGVVSVFSCVVVVGFSFSVVFALDG